VRIRSLTCEIFSNIKYIFLKTGGKIKNYALRACVLWVWCALKIIMNNILFVQLLQSTIYDYSNDPSVFVLFFCPVSWLRAMNILQFFVRLFLDQHLYCYFLQRQRPEIVICLFLYVRPVQFWSLAEDAFW
jgi:hypothetical protein